MSDIPLFSVDTSKVREQLNQLIRTLEGAVEAGLTQAAHDGVRKAQTNTYYTPRSPEGLRAKTEFRSTGRLEKHIVANTFYASWVNFGNGPPGGRIYPTRAKALKFQINGQTVFRKWVRTSAPRPFMTNTLSWEEQQAPNIVAAHIGRLLERL